MKRLKAIWRVLTANEFFLATSYEHYEGDGHHEDNLRYEYLTNTKKEKFKNKLYIWLYEHEKEFNVKEDW